MNPTKNLFFKYLAKVSDQGKKSWLNNIMYGLDVWTRQNTANVVACNTLTYLHAIRRGKIIHHDLVDRYGIFVSQMTTDMFHLS